ncbi:MAG: DUF4382 domain-containing protein, partial [Rhodothermales bacterium]
MRSGNQIWRRALVAPTVLLLVLATAFTLSACDGIMGTSSEGNARLNVRLIDAPFPFDLVDEVTVTISHVEIIGDEGRVTITDDDTTFNLLDLRNGVSALLGSVDVPAGTYSEARFTVDDASVLLKDGREFDMKIPSGKIKVLLDDLVVEDGQVVTLTLDFDVNRSFVVNGNPATPAGIKGFLFKPTIVPARVEHDDDDDDEGEHDDDGEDDDDGE